MSFFQSIQQKNKVFFLTVQRTIFTLEKSFCQIAEHEIKSTIRHNPAHNPLCHVWTEVLQVSFSEDESAGCQQEESDTLQKHRTSPLKANPEENKQSLRRPKLWILISVFWFRTQPSDSGWMMKVLEVRVTELTEELSPGSSSVPLEVFESLPVTKA